MAPRNRFQAMLTTLQDPELRVLAQEAVRHYISWEEISGRPPLPGLDAQETWDLLAFLRRFDAITFPIPTLSGLQYWYTITREGWSCLEDIAHHCRSDSQLHLMLQERAGRHFLVRSRIEEAVASCQLDGVVFNRGIAGRMLRQTLSPKGPAERLVLNAFEMLGELDALAGESFTPDFVHGLYERLTRDVEIERLERGPRKTNLAGTRNPDESLDAAGIAGRLQMICDYANGETGEAWEPIPLRGYMILSAMAYWHPLPDFNDAVGRHMMRLFAIKNGFPALAYLPTSLMMERWFEREIEPGVVRFETLGRRQILPGETDGTPDMLLYLELTTAAIELLKGYIETARQAEEALQTSLLDTADLNYRQRSVLSRALVNPDAEFRISEHQQAHKVVYQTARVDLLELVDRGLLRMEQRGRAFVFTPGEALRTGPRG